MPLALIYLVQRGLFRIADFFRHWYGDAPRAMAHWLLSFLEGLDRVIALRITLRHFFEPLYQDWSVVGRVLGVPFRLARAAVGIVLYALVAGVWGAVVLVWCAIPLVLIFYGLGGA